MAARGLWVPGPRPEVEPEPGRQVKDGAAGLGRGEKGSPGSEAGAAGSQPPDLLRPPGEPQGTPSVTWRPPGSSTGLRRGRVPPAAAGLLWLDLPIRRAEVDGLRRDLGSLSLPAASGLCPGGSSCPNRGIRFPVPSRCPRCSPRAVVARAHSRKRRGEALRQKLSRGFHFPARLRSGLSGFLFGSL